jgi:hypothetical protein
MTLIKTNIDILTQLKELLLQFSNEQYAKPLEVLSENTIGKHVRHVVEFYECLLKGVHQQEINYDKRERNLQIETNIEYTLNIIEGIIAALEQQKVDVPIKLAMEYQANETFHVTSTYFRELVYNIEHAIHHFAIMSIAVKASFPEITLAENFGTAYSTIQYQEKQCAQ